jgi:hypothetical protein
MSCIFFFYVGLKSVSWWAVDSFGRPVGRIGIPFSAILMPMRVPWNQATGGAGSSRCGSGSRSSSGSVHNDRSIEFEHVFWLECEG